MIRRVLLLLALLGFVAACEQPSLVLPSGVSTSIATGDHDEGTPGPLESIPPLEEASAACATLALVDQVLDVPGESPPPSPVAPAVLALEIGTLAEDLHQVALETPGSVAPRIDALSVALAEDKAALLAGIAPPRAWVADYEALRTDFGGLC